MQGEYSQLKVRDLIISWKFCRDMTGFIVSLSHKGTVFFEDQVLNAERPELPFSYSEGTGTTQPVVSCTLRYLPKEDGGKMSLQLSLTNPVVLDITWTPEKPKTTTSGPTQETPGGKKTPVVKETPGEKDKPVIKETPVVKDKPVIKETPVVKDKPGDMKPKGDGKPVNKKPVGAAPNAGTKKIKKSLPKEEKNA